MGVSKEYADCNGILSERFYNRWCGTKGYVIGGEPEHSWQAIKDHRATAAPRPKANRSGRRVKASAKVAALSGDKLRGVRSKPSPVKERSDAVRPRRINHAVPLPPKTSAPKVDFDALREQMKGLNIGKTHGRRRPDQKEDAPAPALESASESKAMIKPGRRRGRKRNAARKKAALQGMEGTGIRRRLAEAELSF